MDISEREQGREGESERGREREGEEEKHTRKWLLKMIAHFKSKYKVYMCVA